MKFPSKTKYKEPFAVCDNVFDLEEWELHLDHRKVAYEIKEERVYSTGINSRPINAYCIYLITGEKK